MSLLTVPQRISDGMFSFPLIAVPFFITAGYVLNHAGLTTRIFDFITKCIGHVKGSLGLANIIASMIFAGMSGSAIADAGGLGVIEIKAMEEQGFDKDFSVAVTAASSVIGPIIPPSIVMVIYAVMAEESIARLFIGGIIPGLMAGFSLMVLVYYMASNNKTKSPTTPRSNFKEIRKSFKRAFFPLLAPAIILGSIIFGIVTPSEAGVLAILYGFLLGFIYKEIALKDVPKILAESVVSTAVPLLVTASAYIFGWVLVLERLPQKFAELFLTYTDNPLILLLMLNLILLIMGCFIETIAVLVIVTPVIVPLATMLGIDLTALGVIMVFNLTIGTITPPVGVSLFVLSDLSGLSVEKIFNSLKSFYIPLIVTLLLITIFPVLITYLPDLFL